MKVLIIGSKGFIGRHTYSCFSAKKQYTCWGCDIAEDVNDKNYFQVNIDNADYAAIFKLVQFDVCINCSGAANVPESITNPLRDFELNTLNVVKILDSIRNYASHCKFINLSSAAVYGNSQKLPITEMDGCKPVSPYGFHKMQAEQICQEYHHFFGVPTCSARIFSAFGPGLAKQMFWDWAQKIKSNPAILLFGTGEESRDFIYITDLVAAISCIVENGKFAGEVINVANGKEIFIKDAIRMFQEAWNDGFTYQFNGETRLGDPLNWSADITKLTSLGYRQHVSFNDGIKQLVEWLSEKK